MATMPPHPPALQQYAAQQQSGGQLVTVPQGSGISSVAAASHAPASTAGGNGANNTPRSSNLSSSRAKYALVPHAAAAGGGGGGGVMSQRNGGDPPAQIISPRNLRDISKFVDSNIRLGHGHRSTALSTLIPPAAFTRVRDGGDPLLRLSLAPIHPKESALDIPLRLTCPEEYHAPVISDPRSNSTIASRIVALLKGAASVPTHWEGENVGMEKDVTKLNAIRDSEMRAACANRAQRFDKEARAHVAAGSLHCNAGNLEKALREFTTALQRFEVVGDAQGVAYCHNILGVLYYRAKEFKVALVHHKKQQVLSAAYGRTVALINMGVTYSALGELTFSEQALQDAHASALEARDAVLETIALGNLGLTYMRLGDVRRSQSYVEQCLEHCSLAGDRVGSAVCLLLLGELYSIVDDADHAIFYFEHAFRVAGEAGVADLQEIARVSIGVSRGNQLSKQSLSAFAQRLGQNVGMAELLMSLPQQ